MSNVEEVTPTIMETILAAANDGIEFVGTIITAITGQPLLLFYMACGLIPVGVGLFLTLKRAARR